MAHTPGPWSVHRSNMVTIQDINRHAIAQPLYPLRSTRGAEFTEEEFEDNARLIAAAPELLGELIDVLQWATQERAPLREQEIESIRKVIAKATGQ